MKFDSPTLNLLNIPAHCCRVFACLAGAGLALCGLVADGQNSSGNTESGEIRIVAIEGSVELMPAGAKTWVLTQTNQMLYPGDRLRTGDNSRVTVLWSDKSVVPLGPLTQIEILAPDNPGSLPGLNFVKGVLSFFHREKPGRIRVLTHGANASIEGTEFVLRASGIDSSEQDTLSVIDGKVLFSNSQGSLLLTNGQQAVVEPGKAPIRTAGFIANNILQWCFYYPAVLDLGDLPLTRDEERLLEPSLDAYRAGNLLAALAKFPDLRQPESDSERIYHAAVLLSVGEVDKTESELDGLSNTVRTDRLARLADALRTLIAAVKRQSSPSSLEPELPTEFLADSYYEQSLAKGDASLNAALSMARQATALSPQFGFAWERVAELEFSFGRIRESEAALNKSLNISPENAQALALKGFLLAAQNRIADATAWFDCAIAADGSLGNAWLGRGLCRIRRGDASEGLHDLMVAAATEPQRSLLRSYLAKGYSNANDDLLASREIAIALRLDPNDPTGWLYAALIKQQQNRINGAIGDMEKSQALNDNRQLFRSKMLLDQDNAVRSVNLATMYEDAGMEDVAVREAARAVTYDYDNSSAHLFLSDSYNALRDPTGFDLRYDTAWFNELLLANLLAPVGAGRLSQTLSSQEYSKLFESDGIGIANATSWRTDNQLAQQVGTYGQYQNTAWAGDFEYFHNSGVRANNQLDSLSGDVTIKQQLTPSDTVLGLAQFENFHSGDNRQLYDFYSAYDPTYQYAEHQDPTLVGGYQHEWAPGVRTLLLGSRLEDSQRFSSSQAGNFTVFTNNNVIYDVESGSAPANLQDRLLIYTAEFSQIVQKDRFTLVAGGRWQGGQFDYTYLIPPFDFFYRANYTDSFSDPFQRLEGYGYLTVEPVDKLWLTGGFAYDDMKYPANFRNLPLSGGTDERTLPEPKAALVWSPVDQVTVRGIYSHSLGGVSLDDAYTLEPTELAGLVQNYRSVISESIVGSVSAEDVELEGVALDFKFPHGTYAGLQAQHLTSRVQQSLGDFVRGPTAATATTSAMPEDLAYNEESVSASLNQLLPEGFVAGVSYALTRSELKTTYPEVPASTPNELYSPDSPPDQAAYLHQIDAYLLLNHPSGFFARFDADGYLQRNIGYDGTEPGNDFVQLNIQGGWRFFHRRAQILIGVLNLTGQNYSLNPLTEYTELPRSRVFIAQLNFVF
ncbi:MAG TPA: FecR domain-containing protein [Alphaproteobacteria bacterium]|nr:FecR domain-containing protein [Alphaproteobacteria bacterium]